MDGVLGTDSRETYESPPMMPVPSSSGSGPPMTPLVMLHLLDGAANTAVVELKQTPVRSHCQWFARWTIERLRTRRRSSLNMPSPAAYEKFHANTTVAA